MNADMVKGLGLIVGGFIAYYLGSKYFDDNAKDKEDVIDDKAKDSIV